MPRLIDANKLIAKWKAVVKRYKGNNTYWETVFVLEEVIEDVENAPTVDAVPTEEQLFNEWCHDCKEYDQNAHCCHRWTKVIRNTVNDLKAQGYEIVRHGRWIEAKYPLFTCSECGATYQDNGYGYNYCPNCGAKMDESTMGQVKPSDRERKEDAEH